MACEVKMHVKRKVIRPYFLNLFLKDRIYFMKASMSDKMFGNAIELYDFLISLLFGS